MDIDFIIYFLFLLLITFIIDCTDDGIILIIFGLFFGAVFANTQITTPLFYSNSDFLGFGYVFNLYWLALSLLSIGKSMYIAKEKGIIKG